MESNISFASAKFLLWAYAVSKMFLENTSLTGDHRVSSHRALLRKSSKCMDSSRQAWPLGSRRFRSQEAQKLWYHDEDVCEVTLRTSSESTLWTVEEENDLSRP
ncbi:hypothetical protein SELMODRAFT_404985 [Selaginella moellendorffii]|uniref:Uncharacterized protein n=1 Tax=Selaginella moellendorffii TaxID=88036 RepID=D8QY05_SELML|nr:hypothetical protein SELMODRAFT_404985 [Selaginella moellendorffii]